MHSRQMQKLNEKKNTQTQKPASAEPKRTGVEAKNIFIYHSTQI